MNQHLVTTYVTDRTRNAILTVTNMLGLSDPGLYLRALILADIERLVNGHDSLAATLIPAPRRAAA